MASSCWRCKSRSSSSTCACTVTSSAVVGSSATKRRGRLISAMAIRIRCRCPPDSSSRGDEAGKVQALDLGADDYVTKPFGMDELLARMRAALRHQLQTQGERPVFRLGELSVDLVRRIVKVGEREVKLSPKEYDLLRVLVQHAGKVLTHKFLLGELWDDLTDAQYLRVYVRQLRQKIEADPEQPRYVLTETGVGYRLRAPD